MIRSHSQFFCMDQEPPVLYYRKKTSVAAISLLTALISMTASPLALAAETQDPGADDDDTEVSRATLIAQKEDFAGSYQRLTKDILLSGVELERFSLEYRQHTLKNPRFRRLRFFLTQQTGAAGLLAYEITGVKQFGQGRKRPLTLSKTALENGLNTAMITSIITASGSALELSTNLINGLKRTSAGYGSGAARRFVVEKLGRIDSLLAERKALVEANQDHPDYKRAVAEGEVFDEMRGSFVNEFSHFYADNRKTKVFQNSFFTLNAAYNTVGAIAAGIGAQSLTHPRYTGTSNILFIVTGGMAMITPSVAGATAWVLKKKAHKELEDVALSPEEKQKSDLDAKLKALQELLPDAQGTLIPTLSATSRFGMYDQSRELFDKQMNSEVKTIRRLNKIALETNIMAPPIGGLLMTQGILGSLAYYDYPGRVRKQLDLNYKGAILGTIGSSLTLAGNLGWLLSSMAYEHHLRKNEQLPSQLIEKRLKHLDDIEQVIRTL